ncbi:L-lactate/malate dehydrogenase [Aspergillus heteromorphus CBS 117.55]|uniref:L-lactate/malate dehydrogenase n=1 Tax=Aspergillus heteromorphus CBS 117.55 TaxID=1448321 RepID=A0A317X2Y6_9EURO|nr:L-lactate/malate dehydrogenase [Aspergillus heteromorphus CBS 117.55]PWY91992.1 L-lactate/malate dehydrogenase [Aspergillus heteromorphus CBS 117.55]
MPTIALIGLGSVGASTALSIIHQRIPATLLLVDIKSTLRDAQVNDLSDAALVHGSVTQVHAATHREASQADVVIITAGARYTPGETTLQHLYHKFSILKSILNEMRPFSPHTVILVVANPVDLLTTLAQDIAGLPRKQVIGTGTSLDSIRLRGEVSRVLGTKMEETEGYVIGVRGNESQVIMCSGLLSPYGEDGNSIQKQLEVESKIQRKSKAIVAGKGGAPWGTGAVAGGVAAAMVRDNRRVWTVSCWREDWKCCCSWPVVVGREGVVEEVRLDLKTGEREAVESGVKSLNLIVERIKENEA